MVEILRDFLLADTPFRGLILRTEFCLCAYIGVPEFHWMANMEELDFPCHRGLTFNAPGGDGLRPAVTVCARPVGIGMAGIMAMRGIGSNFLRR